MAKPYLVQAQTAYKRGRAALIRAEKLGCDPLAVDFLKKAQDAAARVRTLANKGRSEGESVYRKAIEASDALLKQCNLVRNDCER